MQNIVTEVIVGKDETDGPTNWEMHYGNFREQVCKRTSYNTRGGVHYTDGAPSADQSKAFRKNYAGIGYTYDETRDAFIPPQPFDSWVLNETSCLWDAPVAYPEDGQQYTWNEETTSWDLITE
ncbi:hypothetical protein [uncultured Polaribacter sp.]|uniref:hypothetical protein n=1 Tax=uncultured Polaribacter sp. TaxID=174711 RepID=UPI00259B2AC6|nr:hypothetical protein [uncultured Polaribacter sp.]